MTNAQNFRIAKWLIDRAGRIEVELWVLHVGRRQGGEQARVREGHTNGARDHCKSRSIAVALCAFVQRAKVSLILPSGLVRTPWRKDRPNQSQHWSPLHLDQLEPSDRHWSDPHPCIGTVVPPNLAGRIISDALQVAQGQRHRIRGSRPHRLCLGVATSRRWQGQGQGGSLGGPRDQPGPKWIDGKSRRVGRDPVCHPKGSGGRHGHQAVHLPGTCAQSRVVRHRWQRQPY